MSKCFVSSLEMLLVISAAGNIGVARRIDISARVFGNGSGRMVVARLLSDVGFC